jgi:hypothetical protein
MRHFRAFIYATLVFAGSIAGAQTNVQGGSSAQSQAELSTHHAGVTADGSSAGAVQPGGAAAHTSGAGALSAEGSRAKADSAGQSEFTAMLSKPVDARNNKPGDEVTATTTQDLKSNGQVIVPRGSKLIGHVTSARPRSRHPSGKESSGTNAAMTDGSAGADSQLGVVFDKAIINKGHEVPLNAVVTAVAATDSSSADEFRDTDYGVAGGGMAEGMRHRGGGLLGATGQATLGGLAGGEAMVGHSASVAGSAAPHAVIGSPGAVGGLDSSGRLISGSRGVFGIQGLEISGAGSAGGDMLIKSSARDVRLERGTQMLLTSSADAGGNASAEASGSRSPSGSLAAVSDNAAGGGNVAGGASADRSRGRPSEPPN